MIIGFSGKKQSGKDTAGLITQTLLDFPNADNATVLKYLKAPLDNPTWKVKRFADYLKKIVAEMTGCSIEDMENDDVKNEVIYTKWRFVNKYLGTDIEYESPEGGLDTYNHMCNIYLRDNPIDEVHQYITYEEIEITRRTFLERIGTGVARQIHSQVWIDYLFKNYRMFSYTKEYSKWLITDTRFPNEAEKILKNGGLLIRVIRRLYWYDEQKVTFKELQELYIRDTGEACTLDYAEEHLKANYSNHESETALDNYQNFDYIIYNEGSLDSLINKIRDILNANNLINV